MSNLDPHDGQGDQNEPIQPGLDPSKTGKPKPSDSRTDPKPGEKKAKPDYRPGD
jgi:hypothetical protein